MHDCPCCSEAVYTDDASDLCGCCEVAGCDGDCQVPSCPACDTRMTFCTDGHWHANCDDETECSKEVSQ